MFHALTLTLTQPLCHQTSRAFLICHLKCGTLDFKYKQQDFSLRAGYLQPAELIGSIFGSLRRQPVAYDGKARQEGAPLLVHRSGILGGEWVLSLRKEMKAEARED